MSNQPRRTKRGIGTRSGFRRGVVAMAAALSLGVLSACSGGGTETERSGSLEGDAPEVAQNQTVTVGVATLQQQFADPVLAREGGNTYAVWWSVGEALIRYDQELQQVPALATEWEVSEDGLTWTVQLREGVKMHDGSDFTARDVETSVKRVQKYGEDFPAQTAFVAKYKSVTAVDDHTVEIVTTVPYANAVFDLPPPVATDYYNEVGEEQFRKAPMAAGPWMFDSQKFNDSMTLKRFEDFWDKERVANFETLVLKILPDESSRISGLQTGQIDVAQGLSPNGAAQLQNASGVTLVESEQASIGSVYFVDNYFEDDSALKDVRVRKALSLAIDRKSLVSALYQDFADVPTNITLPVTLGHDETLEAMPYDVDEAKKLLAEAGAEDLSFDLSLYNATTAIPDVVKFAEAIAGYWREIGVNVKVNVMDPATYLDKVVKHQLRGAIILGGAGPVIADPDKLAVFFSSTGGFSTVKGDQELDDLFADLSSTVDREQQEEIAGEISTYLHETLYALPVITADAIYGLGPNIASFDMMKSNPYAGPFYYLRAK